MHLHEHTEKVHEGRHHRSCDDGLVGHIEELDHQESRSPQHRRRDLPTGGRRRLHGPGKFAAIAHADHGRDRERPHGHCVGHRRTTEHAEHGRSKHADLGGTTRITTGDARRDVQKQLAQANAGGQHAKQHEMEHVGRHHPHRHAINALAGEVLVVDHLAPGGAGMFEQPREIGPRQGIGGKADRDQRQGPSHGPSGGLEQRQEQNRAHDDVHGVGVAHPKRQIVKHIGDVHDAGRTGQRQQPVHHRHPTRTPSARARHA